MSWEDHESMFRPEGVHMGLMVSDPELCDACKLCIENCPLGTLEFDEDKHVRAIDGAACFSCFNCMVACETGSMSIKEVYHVDRGFYATDPQPLHVAPPLEPLDADGEPDEWTVVEKAIIERRSVRNYRSRPVPDHLIRRVLEAGRFAPSGGNCQPWKFVVVTDKALIKEMDESIVQVCTMMHAAYTDDNLVKNLVPLYEANPTPGSYDPRIAVGGLGSVARKVLPVFLKAPVVILIAVDERAIGGPDIAAGICGQNMNMAALSLGLGACWVGFSQIIEMNPPLKAKLALEDPWKIRSAMVLGYPKFAQEGIVPREDRPVTWFRKGGGGPELEDQASRSVGSRVGVSSTGPAENGSQTNA